MIRRPPRSTQSRSSAASDVYKRQLEYRRRNTLSSHINYQSAAIVYSILVRRDALRVTTSHPLSPFELRWKAVGERTTHCFDPQPIQKGSPLRRGPASTSPVNAWVGADQDCPPSGEVDMPLRLLLSRLVPRVPIATVVPNFSAAPADFTNEA
eukprot:TRINITY_DN1730_c0_g1_i1.p1 TRINITY_DN1730_c0_g1~~TRINITY_DN1730_c0_g1_i1.p1  ORF type:complete len:153 (+),score=15.72 TRINITY_DN1730_c0_g1_i1:107-565(+)